MTEMLEMANILHNATARSFVVLDELGRGTSTYDGLSLAKSICVYISKKLGCKTLFATHYHELIHLEKELPWFHNVSVSVYETDKRVVFLKKIVDGWANKSYWLDVAKLAGIPQEVVDSALRYLKELELDKTWWVIPQQTWFDFGVWSEMSQKLEEIQERFEQIAVNGMTPLEALNELERLREYVLSK